jgi:hypothetical protein
MIYPGMIMQAIGIWLILLSQDTYFGILVGMSLLGIGTAFVYPTLLAAISDIAHPQWRATSLGVYRFWRDLGFVIGALGDEIDNTIQKSNNVNSTSNAQPMPYDCNEGGIVSTSKDSIGLFSTMNKFVESSSLYQASSKTSPLANSNNKEVKITLLNPLDAKKIKDLDNVQFTAMVKGEYQIKKMDIKNEIKKLKIKDTLKVPFVFNAQTGIGPIQIGDYYFGCITANDYWSKEHSECEKRFIQHLDKSNDLPVAH